MEVVDIDPHIEMTGDALKTAVCWCLDNGLVLINTYQKGRMEERQVTALEIESALRTGLRATESYDDKWRYRATKRGVVVIFTFDVDEDGNMLVVVTTWKEGKR